MNIGNLLYPLPENIKGLIRKIEKEIYKLNGLETAVIFNQICLKEGLLPNYTNIRLHDPAARRESTTIAFRRSLVDRQLREKKEEKSRCYDRLQQLRQEWQTQGDHPNRQDIRNALQTLGDRDYARRERTILNKLVRYNGGNIKVPQRESNAYVNLTNYTPTGAFSYIYLYFQSFCHFHFDNGVRISESSVY